MYEIAIIKTYLILYNPIGKNGKEIVHSNFTIKQACLLLIEFCSKASLTLTWSQNIYAMTSKFYEHVAKKCIILHAKFDFSHYYICFTWSFFYMQQCFGTPGIKRNVNEIRRHSHIRIGNLWILFLARHMIYE